MRLYQTRTSPNEQASSVEFSEALLSPSSAHGGLYAPLNLPKFSVDFWQKAKNLDYQNLALEIIKMFEFDVDMGVFERAVKRYAKFDKPDEPVQLRKVGQNLYINELYHGPTRAFKDMALQPFGAILSQLASARDEKYLIMCATSGDTGPATLDTFANTLNIRVVCLYPKDGTSEVQRLQMINASAQNLKVIGINGNFDDAQRALKSLLASHSFKAQLARSNTSLSAANSVNFGRILFQIIYHVYAYARLLNLGEIEFGKPADIVVPSGNFGNALGAYYAKKMGTPIGKIKIVSNVNNILTELFTTGRYDLRGKELVKTISPAMDILISSNIERLLVDKFGTTRTKELMDALNTQKFYELTASELGALREEFEADFCDDQTCEGYIKEQASRGVVVDPHTATCFKMAQNLQVPTIITSTAHWVKFAPSMFHAIKGSHLADEKAGLEALASEFKDSVPSSVSALFTQKPAHTDVVDTAQLEGVILEWIAK